MYTTCTQSLKMVRSHILLLLILALQVLPVFGQTFTGTVRDADTKETMPFVNILIQGTEIGGFTDVDGNYKLIGPMDTATLIFSYLGYAPTAHFQKAGGKPSKVKLSIKDVEIDAVTIVPEYSYDHYLFKQILAHKAQNNPDKNTKGEYLDYSRTFVCLSNLNIDIKDKRIFKGSETAFMQESDSSLLMPIFFSEEVTTHEAAKSEVIRSRTNGILQQMDQQVQSLITERLTARMNFYDEQLVFLTRGFPGPLAHGARLFYNIYVVDSAEIEGVKQYKFDFYPKNSRNITFRGSFWVEDGTFALIKVSASLPNTANINFVRDLGMEVSYRKGPNGTWFYDSQTMQMKIALSKKDPGKKQKSSYLVRKTIDFHAPESWNTPDVTVNAANLTGLSDDKVFSQVRRTDLDSFEVVATKGIATLQDNNFVKLADRFAAMGFTGYFNAGKIDLGPMYDTYRRNAVEGNRFTLSMRTSQQFADNFSLGGYLGYGFKSKELKYGGNINYQFNTKSRTTLSLKYSDDYYALSRNKFIEFVRENPFSQGDGNPISNFTSTRNPYILGRQHLSLSLQLQTKKDIGLLIRPFHNRYKGTTNVSFSKDSGNSFLNTGILLDARFSFHQKYDDIFFNRFYYGNGKPVIHLTAEVGRNQVNQKATPYAHLQASIKNRFVLGPVSVKMLIDAGYIAGKVPYPLLHLPRGAQSLGLGRYNYSLLNQASFASDVYSNAYLAMNGGGIIFNRLPLIKKLNLRESVSFKAFYGRMTRNHEDIFQLPNGIYKAPNSPYMEVGLGVSNIFKFLRVEYVRRMSDSPFLDKVSSKNGIRMRIQMSF